MEEEIRHIADGGGESPSGKKIGKALQLGWVQPPRPHHHLCEF
jgi:hypothetical protein